MDCIKIIPVLIISMAAVALCRESCYAPPGGVMSPPCVAHESVIGSGKAGCRLFYKISGPDSFNLCCDGYGLGGWRSIGCGNNAFTGKYTTKYGIKYCKI